MPRVTLRPVEDADLPILYAHQADPAATAMADFPSRDEAAFRAHWARIRADEATWLRTVLADGVVAGHVLSFLRGGVREVGYWLGREWWGRGIATEALAQFVAELPMRPLHAGLVKTNTGSRRVLEKCGFRLLREEGADFVYVLDEDPAAPDPGTGPTSAA